MVLFLLHTAVQTLKSHAPSSDCHPWFSHHDSMQKSIIREDTVDRASYTAKILMLFIATSKSSYLLKGGLGRMIVTDIIQHVERARVVIINFQSHHACDGIKLWPSMRQDKVSIVFYKVEQG